MDLQHNIHVDLENGKFPLWPFQFILWLLHMCLLSSFYRFWFEDHGTPFLNCKSLQALLCSGILCHPQ
jgi:hypothetical protein